jgi:hypothetical protein
MRKNSLLHSLFEIYSLKFYFHMKLDLEFLVFCETIVQWNQPLDKLELDSLWISTQLPQATSWPSYARHASYF